MNPVIRPNLRGIYRRERWDHICVLTWLAIALGVLIFWGWALAAIQPIDFTDSGVGCLDDCLESAGIQDEADTLISTERN